MADAEAVLNELLDRIIDEPHKNGKRILTPLISANYTSALFFITITAKNKDDLKLFAKAAIGKGQIKNVKNIKLMFNIELFIYSELGKIYEKIQDKHKVAPEYRFTLPKFYGGERLEGQEIVVLEDLVSKGYNTYNRLKSIDWEHAASAVESLARFHALSFAFEKEEPVRFANVLERLKYNLTELDECSKKTGLEVLEGVIEVTKKEHKAAIANFLLVKSQTAEENNQLRLPLSRPVVCHGDFRMDNLLFQRQNGVLRNVVFDYQACHSECAPIDLLYLLFTATDEEFRRENYQRFMDHYFQELTLALSRLGININDVYPRKLFEDEIRKILPVMLRLAPFFLPMVLTAAQNALQFGTAGDSDRRVVAINQLCAERFNGIVNDCVRWGVI